ncbi:MAG: hypothetical protein ACI9U2_000796 [Bradymonadia bacterium]|jgi:hypothetical protein
MGIGGGVLLVLGVILIFVHVRSKRRAGYLIAARPSKAGELAKTAGAVAAEIEGGDFRHFASLYGQSVCPSPLISPLAERPCLYYSMTITRRYEEDYYTTDNEGRRVRRTRTGSQVMSSETDDTPFDLDDSTGSIDVNPRDADYDGLVETVDRFEPGHAGHGQLRMGRWSLSIGGVRGDRRTLGYHYAEKVLPVDQALTVVAEVSDASGALVLGAGGPVFIVSTRTKKEIIGSAEKIARLTAAISGICVLGGIGLLVAHLLS